MKTIFRIHPFFYFFALICLLTGYIKNFIIVMIIILFHELGHISAALYYKWHIKKIVILPFGGITIFEENINKPIKEELVIALMGPIFQCVFFLFDEFYIPSLCLLIFNLLPIIPLDGSKIFNLLFNKIFSFSKSHFLSIYLSFIIILFLTLYFKFNLILILILSFLFYKTYNELKNHNYYFNKFLFERYIYKFSFKKQTIIANKYQMKRDYKHLFFINKKYITEESFLKHLFDN